LDEIAGFTLDEMRYTYIELKVGKGVFAYNTASFLWCNNQSRTLGPLTVEICKSYTDTPHTR